MNLRTQKRLAAQIMKVGENKVQFDTESLEQVADAITREDIRILISKGVIKKKQEKGISTGRLKKNLQQKKRGQKKGHGRRSGKKTVRTPKKKAWIKKIRAIRDELRKLKTEKKIDEKTYRKTYLQAKGGLYQSRRHMREHVVKK